MRKTSVPRLPALAVAGLALPAFAQSEEKAERLPYGLETVVVTAQKRQEVLQDVPISIAVLDGNRLDRSTFDGVREALNATPGVLISTNQNSSPQVTMRGVSAASARFTGTGTVAFYLDTVPVGLVKSAIVPDTTAYDLERVEVLRGPQGTLYGASALNGVIRVLTRDADLDEFEFKARGLTSNTEEGDWNYRGDMALNVPIVQGRLAGRIVAGHQNMSGWIDRPIRDNANELEASYVRVKLNAQPTDNLSVGLSAWMSRIDNGAQSIGDDNSRNPALVNEPSADDFDTYGLSIAYDSARFSVSSKTSYLDFNVRSLTSFAPFGIAVVTGTKIEADVFSQELLFSSVGGESWRWSIGGMYRDAEDLTRQAFTSSPALVTDVTDTSESTAVFGELTRIFMGGKLELTGGIRYFEDKVGLDDGLSAVEGSNTFDAVSPRAVLSWLPSDDLTIYASYAEGFRSGANQTPVVFPLAPPTEPDKLKNYEVGAKGSLLDGALSFDLAVYYINWEDFQASRRVTALFGGQPIPTVALVNGESASGPGADLGVTVRATDRLILTAGVSWNDLTLDEDAISGTTLLAREGSRLNVSPEESYSAAADYVFRIGARLEGQLSASANYVSEQKIALNSIIESDPILISRAGFSLRSPDRWTGTLFVDNANNEQGITVALNVAGAPYYNVRPRPRTIGLQFDFSF